MTHTPKTNPIYGTDLTKPSFELLEDIRSQLTRTRGQLYDITKEHPWLKDRVDCVEGGMTLCIARLYDVVKEASKLSRQMRDAINFRSRGTGMDSCPCCYVCGTTDRDGTGDKAYLNNISGYVDSKEDGEKILAMFKQGARLDIRKHEPTYIQLKVGACDACLPALRALDRLVADGGICEADIEASKEVLWIETPPTVV